jgi:hypothetical protein
MRHLCTPLHKPSIKPCRKKIKIKIKKKKNAKADKIGRDQHIIGRKSTHGPSTPVITPLT